MKENKLKSFWTDFKKHVVQAFATLLAGFIIGALLGGAKVIEKQDELSSNQKAQTIQIEKLQDSVDSLAGKDYDIVDLTSKIDSVYAAVKEQERDIDDINRTVDRIFQILQ